MIHIPASAWPASRSYSGLWRDRSRARIIVVASDPPGQLGIRLCPLQDGVPPDQLDLVEEEDPTRVAGGTHEPGHEAEALEGELPLADGGQRVGRSFPHLLEAPAKIRHPDGIACPETHD